MMASKSACLMVASSAAEGVSAESFINSFNLCSSAFNLQITTPGGALPPARFTRQSPAEKIVLAQKCPAPILGKPIDFLDVDDSNMRWIQDFRVKSYASPAKLESIDGSRYHALLIPSCPGAMTDLAQNGYLAKILQHFVTENKPICAIGHGVTALCCAINEDKSWIFKEYSMTGPSIFELVRRRDFANLSILMEDFAKDSGAIYSASVVDAVHVVLDRHLVTGQNDQSTLAAVQNLIILCNNRK